MVKINIDGIPFVQGQDVHPTPETSMYILIVSFIT